MRQNQPPVPTFVFEQLSDILPGLFADYRQRLSSLDVSVKEDQTLLSEADIAIQGAIVDMIRRVDPASPIIAEEGSSGWPTAPASSYWIVDPIDGTAEFLKPSSREFCTAVCRVEAGRPAHAFVYAHELGYNAQPLIVTGAADEVTINGAPVAPHGCPDALLSVTRSSSSGPRAFEAVLGRRASS